MNCIKYVSGLQISDIIFCEKSNNVTYDDIHQLLWRANASNRNTGFILRTSEMTGEELEHDLGENGKCFVALYKGKLIGSLSVKFLNREKWYAKGLIAEFIHIAIDPEYQGFHVLTELFRLGYQAANIAGCNVIELNTADRNWHAIQVYLHYGFKLVDYKANRNGDHYSVVMIRWMNSCPYSAAFIKWRYIAKRMLVRMRYTPSKEKRFGI